MVNCSVGETKPVACTQPPLIWDWWMPKPATGAPSAVGPAKIWYLASCSPIHSGDSSLGMWTYSSHVAPATPGEKDQ